MSQHLIAEFALPIPLDTFCTLFWYDTKWYVTFLCQELQDRNVYVGEWSESEGGGGESREGSVEQRGVREGGIGGSENEEKSKIREIRSEHPSKVSFPGLPSHAGKKREDKETEEENSRFY